MREGKTALVPLSKDTRRSLIWNPDASRGLALIGNSPDTWGPTWHLLTDPQHPTYGQLIDAASRTLARPVRAVTVPELLLRLTGRFAPAAKEVTELLPRYRVDNIFDSSAFLERFPNFKVTSYQEGVRQLVAAD